MRNYKYLLLIIVILLIMPILGFGERKAGDRDLLIGILAEVGADFVEGDIDIGGIILNEFISKEEVFLIGNDIREYLGIRGHFNLGEYYFEELVEEDGYIQLIIQGMDGEDNLATITLSSYEDLDGNGETSLFINFTKKVQFVEINDIIVKMENYFHKYNSPINTTICVVGAFHENLYMG